MEPNFLTPYYFSALLVLVGLFLGMILGGCFFTKVRDTGYKRKEKKENAAFLKGISYFLSNDHDQAIEEFTKAIQINSNTVETYLALGSLFRSKGEVGRAIRIHESIIHRPSIDKKTRTQALYDLGLDFKKAGFVQRAVSAFEEVIEQIPSKLDAYIQLEELYEDTEDWEKAYRTQKKISVLRKTNDTHILAHLQTELGKSCFASNDENSAKKAFKKAISLDSNCIPAFLYLGDLFLFQKDYTRAISMWKKVLKINPSLIDLVYEKIENACRENNKLDDFGKFLKKASTKIKGNPYIYLAFARYLYKNGQTEEAIRELRSALKIEPASIETRKELGKLLFKYGSDDELAAEYQELLEVLDMTKKRFRCQNCGFESENIHWKCPQCSKWDTIVPMRCQAGRFTDDHPVLK